MDAENASDVLSEPSVVSLGAGVTGWELLQEEPGLVRTHRFAARGCKGG